MSVTFTTQSLITAAETAVKNHGIADRQYQADKAKFVKKYQAEHDVRPNLRRLRDELTAFLKTNKYPTKDDAARFRKAAGVNYIDHLYQRNQPSNSELRDNVSAPAGLLTDTRLANYRALIDLLKGHTGETITANQLKLVGFADIQGLFLAATAAGGSR